MCCSSRILIFLAFFGSVAATRLEAQFCAAGLDTSSLHSLGQQTLTIPVKGVDPRIVASLQSAVATWTQCASTQPGLPSIILDSSQPPPTDGVPYDPDTILRLIVLNQAPPLTGKGSYQPALHSGSPTTNSITFWTKCPVDTSFTTCDSTRTVVDFSSLLGKVWTTHEIGHAFGLDHDGCLNGLMNEVPTTSASLAPDECLLAAFRNCDSTSLSPGETCPTDPRTSARLIATVKGLDPSEAVMLDNSIIDNDGSRSQKEFVLPMQKGGGELIYPDKLLLGWSYDISVSYLTNPKKSCTVSNGAGKVQNGSDIHVSVVCNCTDGSSSCPSGDPSSKLLDKCKIAPELCWLTPPDPTDELVCLVTVHTSGFNWTYTTPAGQVIIDQTEVTEHTVRTDCISISGSTATITSVAGADGVSPITYVAQPAENAVVSGSIEIFGGAWDQELGVQDVKLWIDGSPWTTLQYGLEMPGACQPMEGVDTTNCPLSHGFYGILDTTALPNGPHTLQVVAVNSRSPYPLPTVFERHISVQNCLDTIKPTISMTSPVAGSTVSGTVQTQASAADNGQVVRVDFYVDGTKVASDFGSPYSYAWNTVTYKDGQHIVQGRAIDGCGNGTTSAGVSVQVDNIDSPPTATLISPQNGGALRGVVPIQASAKDDRSVVRVDFYVDGSLLASDPTSPYVASWNTVASTAGSHSVWAVAYDSAGQAAKTTTVGVTVDNVPPRLYVDVPTQSATISGILTGSGWATDTSKIASLSLKFDGVTVALSSPYTYGTYRPDVCNVYPGDPNCPKVGWSAKLDSSKVADGSHSLVVTAVDTAGNAASFTRSIIVQNSSTVGLAVSLDAPANGALLWGQTTVSATASGATRVNFYLDGALLASDSVAPYTAGWQTTSSVDGSHTLFARAFDSFGNQVTSATAIVRTDNTGPRIYVDSPGSGVTVSGTQVAFFGWATDTSRVASLAFYIDGAVLPLNFPYQYGFSRPDVCSVYPGDPRCPYVGWNAQFDSTLFMNGNHTLEVLAFDTLGRSTHYYRTVSIQN